MTWISVMVQPFRRISRVGILCVLSGLVAFATEAMFQVAKEAEGLETLDIEAERRAVEVGAQTLNGNVMGAVSVLGLINFSVKHVAQGTLPPDDPTVQQSLQAMGQSFGAIGVFIINRQGIVQMSWDSNGVSSRGIDVTIRPYFQSAIRGVQNVYAAVSLISDERSLFFAAPIRESNNPTSPVIGALVMRMGLDQVGTALRDWPAPALLASPGGVVFASNRDDWIGQIFQGKSEADIDVVRQSRQFGKFLEVSPPHFLPFSAKQNLIQFDGHRYAVARANVDWNDVKGPWQLVLLRNLDDAMSISAKIKTALVAAISCLVLGGLFLAWRKRLAEADDHRRKAEAITRDSLRQRDQEFTRKTVLAELAADLYLCQSREVFAEVLLGRIAGQMSIHYGAFYIARDGDGYFVAAGGYGVLAQNLAEIEPGEGMIGQSARDRKIVTIDTGEQIGITIEWGEGRALPTSIIALPLCQNETCLAVLVLAGLQAFSTEHQDFLIALLPMVTANLEILERNLAMHRQASDLNQQKRALEQTEGWYRQIIESSPDGLLVANENDVIILSNLKAETIFGYSPSSLIGLQLDALLPRINQLTGRTASSATSRRASDRNGNKQETEAVACNGRRFVLTVAKSTLPALGDHGICLCLTIYDRSSVAESG